MIKGALWQAQYRLRREEVQTGCEDSIEVINVTDIDGRIWPGHMARLKNYAKRNNL